MKIEDIIDELNKLYLDNVSSDDLAISITFIDGVHFSLYGTKTQEKLENLISGLYNSNKEIKQKIAKETLGLIIEHMLASDCLTVSNFKNEIDRINNEKKYIYIVSLKGINDEKLNCVEINQVLFFNSANVDNVLKTKGYSVLDNILYEELDKSGILLGVEVKAYDQKKAKEKFDFILNEVLDMMKFVICEYNTEMLITYENNFIKNVKKYFASDESCGSSLEYINDIRSYAVNISNIFASGSFGNYLLTIVQKETRSDIETRIINSISLYLHSMENINSKGFSVMLIFSAFEILLMAGSDIPGGLVLSVAQMLAIINGSTYEERIEIIKMYTNASKIRSAFIHHGENKGENKIDIIELYKLFINTLRIICLEKPYCECNSASSLYEEVKKKLYS